MADMTPDTATNQECRDYIRACKYPTYVKHLDHWHDDDPDNLARHEMLSDPVPDTLDGAYASLPPGWMWDILEFGDDMCQPMALAYREIGDGVCSRAPAMKDAMFRTACKAWAVVVRGKDQQ